MNAATPMHAADDALGRLDRLREMLAHCDAEQCLVGDAAPLDLPTDTIALVNDAGARPVTSSLAELLTNPAPWPAAVFPAKAFCEAPVPSFGPPDCLLDDHALWIVASWACGHGVPVLAWGAPPDAKPPLVPAGRAWLVQQLIARLDATVLARIDLAPIIHAAAGRRA